jgi:hypothetical protein
MFFKCRFSPGTPVPSTNTTDLNDITEILFESGAKPDTIKLLNNSNLRVSSMEMKTDRLQYKFIGDIILTVFVIFVLF